MASTLRGKPLPWKLREAIWRLLAEGRTHRAIAAELSLAKATVGKYAKSCAPSQVGFGRVASPTTAESRCTP